MSDYSDYIDEFSHEERLARSEKILEPSQMISMYLSGAFPMADSKDSEIVEWFEPKEHCIIPLDNYNIPRSLKKYMREHKFELYSNRDFPGVLAGCSDREETWLSERLKRAYTPLYNSGFIRTVEVYEKEVLVGGLYGLSLFGVFLGESMFSKKPQASKVAFAHLIKHLEYQGFSLLDVQLHNPHLEMFGAKNIDHATYFKLLEQGLNSTARF